MTIMQGLWQNTDCSEVRGSEARHTTTTQYYRDMKKKNEALEAETRLLQEKKTEAQEELKLVKAEIRTDKLKNAATDTATALASSVGSLFGSGRMKSLERAGTRTYKTASLNLKTEKPDNGNGNKPNDYRR